MNHDTRAFRRRTVLGERERTKRKFRTRVRYLVPKEKKKKRKARSVTCREINERWRSRSETGMDKQRKPDTQHKL